MIFVYVKGLHGPAPEKWPQMLLDMHNKPRPYLVKYDLTAEEDKLTLLELVRKYPPPKMQESESTA
jgi:hypothetical protein